MPRPWARVIDAVPLYRLRIEAVEVDPLRVELVRAGARPAYLAGVAAVHLDGDDFGGPEHRLSWREQRDGRYFDIGYDEPGAVAPAAVSTPAARPAAPRGEGPDPRVADVLRRLDRGAVGVLAGDPVSLLAAEVRRLRGER